jgi:hypothetical protein
MRNWCFSEEKMRRELLNGWTEVGGDMGKKTKREEWEELIVGRMKGGESNEGRARFM